MPQMVPFDWADPLDLDSQLSDEERMIRDAARGFAQDALQPRVIDAYRDELAAPELFPLMGEAGLLGVTMSSVAPAPVTSLTAWSRARSRESIRATGRWLRSSRAW